MIFPRDSSEAACAACLCAEPRVEGIRREWFSSAELLCAGGAGGGGSHVSLGHHGPRCKLASLKAVWNAPQSPVEGALWVSRLYLVQVLEGMQVVQTLVETWWGALGIFVVGTLPGRGIPGLLPGEESRSVGYFLS